MPRESPIYARRRSDTTLRPRSIVRFLLCTSSSLAELLKRYAMSGVLALLCAYVVGLDNVDNEKIRDIMNRSQVAATAMYAQHLRCRPHQDVDSAMAAHDLLRERVKITKVYDVIKDENATEMRKITNCTSFVGVSDILSDLSANECYICQSGDPSGGSVTGLPGILLKNSSKDILLLVSGKNELVIHRDRASVHAALSSLLKTSPGRIVCTRVARR